MDQTPECKIRTIKTTVGKTLEDIGLGNYFLNRTPIAQEIRIKITN
jgi:hypothetical protein